MARDVTLRFVSDTRSLKQGFKDASKGAQDTQTLFGKVSGSLGGVSTQTVAAAAGIAGVTTSIVGFASMAVAELGKNQKSLAQTEAAIRSTGSAANVTAGHIGTMANSLAKMSGVDDDVVQAGENMLLTFTNIRNGVGKGNDIFDQATKAALDMSVALGDDMTSSAIRVGKALQDPILGVTALRRVGVLLTDQQEKAIKGFVATGDQMSAQRVILQELNKEFGGSAQAFGNTLPGAIGKARTAFENWSADVAAKALPAVQDFAGAVGGIAEAVGPGLLGALKTAGETVVSVGRFLAEHKGYVIAAGAAYLASLVPAVLTTVKAFALMKLEQVAVSIGLLIGKVRELAEEMGLLRFSLASLGIGAFVALAGGFIQSMEDAKKAAKDMADQVDKGFDLSTFEGNVAAYNAQVQSAMDSAQKFAQYQNPVKRALTGIWEALPFTSNTMSKYAAENHEAAQRAEEHRQALERARTSVKAIAGEYGVGTAEVEAFARAHSIDLTGAIDETEQKLRDQYGVTAEATKGWTGYGMTIEDVAAIQKTLSKAFEDAADPVNVFKDSIQAATKAMQDQASTDKDALEKRQHAEKAALESEKITGKASQAVHDRKMKELDARQQAERDAADTTAKSNQKATLSMEQYRKKVEENTKNIKTWMKNLAVISARGAGDIVDDLAKLGPEQSGLVADIAKSPQKSFDTFVGTMRDASKTATDASADELNKLPGQLQTIADTSGKTFADTLLQQVAEGIKPLSDIVAQAAIDALNAGIAAATSGVHDKAQQRDDSRSGGGVPLHLGPYIPTSSDPFARHAEGHVAQIAPAGSWRLWAEPETGGEAYIPLAMAKRGRSTALVADVARRFGYGLVPMAEGGMWAVPASRSSGTVDPGLIRALGRLEQRLARNGGNQFVFNEKIDPVHAAAKIAWKLRG